MGEKLFCTRAGVMEFKVGSISVSSTSVEITSKSEKSSNLDSALGSKSFKGTCSVGATACAVAGLSCESSLRKLSRLFFHSSISVSESELSKSAMHGSAGSSTTSSTTSSTLGERERSIFGTVTSGGVSSFNRLLLP